MPIGCFLEPNRCQLVFFLLQKCSSQLFLVEKDATCEHSLKYPKYHGFLQHWDLNFGAQTMINSPRPNVHRNIWTHLAMQCLFLLMWRMKVMTMEAWFKEALVNFITDFLFCTVCRTIRHINTTNTRKRIWLNEKGKQLNMSKKLCCYATDIFDHFLLCYEVVVFYNHSYSRDHRNVNLIWWFYEF